MLELSILYTLLGLAIGSFLNVCIYRLPRRESVVLPSSHCPHCGAAVRALDNVPVLSYLRLRGRCRACGSAISLQYPSVEILTGLSFWLCAARWEFTPATFVNSLLLSILIVLVWIDFHHQILPNIITLPGLAAGLLLSPFQDSDLLVDLFAEEVAGGLGAGAILLPWSGSVLGALVGSGTLLGVGLAYQVVRKRQGIGMGDVKMMACVGAFLGWRLALLTIFAGSLLGSIAGVFLILFRGRDLQAKLAFGTFLGSAAALALFFGLPFLDWYLPAR